MLGAVVRRAAASARCRPLAAAAAAAAGTVMEHAGGRLALVDEHGAAVASLRVTGGVAHSPETRAAACIDDADAVRSLLAHAKVSLAAAALPGLCDSISKMGAAELAAEFGAEAAEAVVAVATGTPRPGHSVLGRGTFAAAEPAWVTLAERFAEEEGAWEAQLFRRAGGVFSRVAHLADTSPRALRDYGGAVALFEFSGAGPE